MAKLWPKIQSLVKGKNFRQKYKLKSGKIEILGYGKIIFTIKSPNRTNTSKIVNFEKKIILLKFYRLSNFEGQTFFFENFHRFLPPNMLIEFSHL